jgi:hypothetical protein
MQLQSTTASLKACDSTAPWFHSSKNTVSYHACVQKHDDVAHAFAAEHSTRRLLTLDFTLFTIGFRPHDAQNGVRYVGGSRQECKKMLTTHFPTTTVRANSYAALTRTTRHYQQAVSHLCSSTKPTIAQGFSCFCRGNKQASNGSQSGATQWVAAIHALTSLGGLLIVIKGHCRRLAALCSSVEVSVGRHVVPL